MEDKREEFVREAVKLGKFLYIELSSRFERDALEKIIHLTYIAKVGDRSVRVEDNNYRHERSDPDDPLEEAFCEISDIFSGPDYGLEVHEIKRAEYRSEGLTRIIKANVRPIRLPIEDPDY